MFSVSRGPLSTAGSESPSSAYPSYAPPACLQGDRLLGQGHQLSPQSDRVAMIVSAADYAPVALFPCQ
jgi:hypothetical protein